MAFLDSLRYEYTSLSDLESVSVMESASFHPTEADSRNTLAKRILFAKDSGPELFFTVKHRTHVIGFISATLSSSPVVTYASMQENDPRGTTVCVHSVCITPAYQRQGIATDFLHLWIERIKKQSLPGGGKKYHRIALLSRPELVSFYARLGFRHI
ncbi:hypothetical protein BDF14DRAFT_1838370 [Spinellus fusiger]|nr:hypothetical protein BDF14DRAFT_1838370 [Spinellus fusiger]